MVEEKRKVGRPKSDNPVAEAPPEGNEPERIELQSGAELIAMALENIATAIANLQNVTPSQTIITGTPQLSAEEQKRQDGVDKINRERIEGFKTDKKAMETKSIEEGSG